MQITEQPNHPIPLKYSLCTHMQLIIYFLKNRDISGGFPVPQYEIYAISNASELTEISQKIFKNQK